MTTNNSTNYVPVQYNTVVGGSSGSIQNITPSSTSGYVLATNGSAANCSFQEVPVGFAINVQKFTSSGTYTPSTGLVYADVFAVGGGGGGSGCAAGEAATVGTGGAGSCGTTGRLIVSAASIGASQVVTIPAGGAGGSAGQNNGSSGGTTSLGSLLVANGGQPGLAIAVAATVYRGSGSGTAVSGTGDVQFSNRSGNAGSALYLSSGVQYAIGGGASGGTIFGGAPMQVGSATDGVSLAGIAGLNPGAGGGGACSCTNGSAQAGGTGGSGLIIITEYLAV